MELNITVNDVAEWIAEVLRAQVEQTDDCFLFKISWSNSENTYELSKEHISGVLLRLTEKSEFEETAIYDECTYEVLLKQENISDGIPFSYHLRDGDLVKRDEENKITYTVSPPSDEFLFFLLFKLAKIAPLRLSFDAYRFRNVRTRNGERIEGSVLEILKTMASRFITLRVESERNKSIGDFVRFANSFFFQFSYNLDIAIMPHRYLNDLVRTSRIEHRRRVSMKDLEAPKRFYTRDLIYHYQLAIAADSPPLEYLSFYHVAEHFFEAAFNDDLISRVRDRITQPDFSSKRKKDIKNIIELVGKSLKYRGENVVYSELEALRLTIEKHVDIVTLVEKIREYDEELIKFYRENSVPFSDGDRVDFEGSDLGLIVSSLAKRIYKTRNAIVHSKESEKVRYIPFDHDRLLILEAPLVRFIAELIILNNSTEIP